MSFEIKVTRITAGVDVGLWQWRMRRGQPCNRGWNGRWLARCDRPFADAFDADKSARRLATLMETTGDEVTITPAKYDFPGRRKARRKDSTPKTKCLAAGPYGAMAKYGVFVIRDIPA